MTEQENKSVAPEVVYVERKDREKRNNWVFATSIVLTIAGAFVAIGTIAAYFALMGNLVDLPMPMPSPTGMFIMLILNVELYFGIFGILSARKPKRGKTLMVLGIIMLLMHVGSAVLAISEGEFNPAMTLGFVLKIMYIYGGYQLHQRHKNDHVNLPDYEEI